ncbi:MAG TPA: hypothetical protein VFV78_00695 [Vicinamibacterales bacterium]|nr:hypothetical protein [Vicinamibacterales bacterium]
MSYFSRSQRSGVAAVAIGAGFLMLSLGLRAAQAPAGGGAGALVPMTASTILRNPDAHMGERVSMMATVEAIVSKTAFTMDQDGTKSTGQELLVLAPNLTAAPDRNAYLTVQGEVMKFDPAELAKKAPTYTLDLPADILEKFRGRPCVLATAVVTNKLVDLEKKPIVPMTPAELAFQKLMTTIQASFPAVRAGLDQPNAATALKDQAAAVKKSFMDAQAYFGANGPAGAAKLAGDALAFATTIDDSLTAGKIEDAKTAATGLQQLCATCHGQFRERLDDGSYRIKSGG